MKSLLLFLIALTCFAQTDLPGPLSALPDAGGMGNAHGVCSWNAAQTHKVCLTADNALGSDITLTSTGSALQVPNGLYSLGDSTHRLTNVYTQAVTSTSGFNLDAISTAGLTLQTGSLGNMAVYTAGSHRFQIDYTGNTWFDTLAGTGTRCVRTDPGGSISAAACTVTNSSLSSLSCGAFMLSATWTDICTPGITITDTGTWQITVSVFLLLTSSASTCEYALNLNGTLLSPGSYPYALFTATGPSQVGASITQVWTLSLSAGDVVKVQGLLNAGSAQTNGGNISAIFLHS